MKHRLLVMGIIVALSLSACGPSSAPVDEEAERQRKAELKKENERKREKERREIEEAQKTVDMACALGTQPASLRHLCSK